MGDAKTAFLTLPLKRTDKLDWVKPLETFIRTEYGQQSEQTNETEPRCHGLIKNRKTSRTEKRFLDGGGRMN